MKEISDFVRGQAKKDSWVRRKRRVFVLGF